MGRRADVRLDTAHKALLYLGQTKEKGLNSAFSPLLLFENCTPAYNVCQSNRFLIPSLLAPPISPITFLSQLHVLLFFFNQVSLLSAACMHMDVGPSTGVWVASQGLYHEGNRLSFSWKP